MCATRALPQLSPSQDKLVDGMNLCLFFTLQHAKEIQEFKQPEKMDSQACLDWNGLPE